MTRILAYEKYVNDKKKCHLCKNIGVIYIVARVDGIGLLCEDCMILERI